MPNIFESQGFTKPGYSGFDLSREQKLTCEMGYLIPTYLDEVVPGDSFKVKTETLLRLAPMLAPIMHRVDLSIHYFYVPNRIIWSAFEDFITGGKNANAIPSFPRFQYSDTVADSRLSDYFGLPKPSATISTSSQFVSQLPYRAYLKIWNDYFRDENLEDEIDAQTATQTQLLTLRQRCWTKDYFTSALPWAQRGGATPAAAPIQFAYKNVSTVSPVPASEQAMQVNTSGQLKNSAGQTSRIENIESGSMSILISELRKTSAIQRWLEKQARGGYRYIETILSQFGVKSDDLRLQRPQYLGGGKQPVVISEVLNTTGTAEAPQGDMAGHGYSSGVTNSFSETFKEHGYVMGILSILPKPAYQQGIPKHFNRFSRYDFYWPEFANLGEQEIKNSEIFFDKDDVGGYNSATFGYQQRYAEYKYGNSTVHGDFRTSLNYWHMGRIFSTPPALNANFVKADPTKRIFAVETGDPVWIQLYHDVKARRPMPYFADPRLS